MSSENEEVRKTHYSAEDLWGGEHELLQWFATDHLSDGPARIVREYRNLALQLDQELDPDTQKDVALQALIESKDAAVRAWIAMNFKGD